MNAMHQIWGHLFQGRYKAKIIDDSNPEYFRKVSDYIHLNPAAAGLLTPKSRPRLESYARSSFPCIFRPLPNAQCGSAPRPSFLTTASKTRPMVEKPIRP